MKTLTLLRHAKSSWNGGAVRDFDRGLNDRGHRAARAIGVEMQRLGIRFDMVLASPAVRVAETLDGIQDGNGFGLDARLEPRMYLASPEALLELVHDAGETVASLLMVGHNPGLEQLAFLLSTPGPLREEVAIKYPTGALAEISLPVDRWVEVASGVGSLTRFIRPRDLDPELGPDEES